MAGAGYRNRWASGVKALLPESKQIAMYDQVGNLPAAWERSADSLLAAASLLQTARDTARATPLHVGDPVSEGERSQPSELMLRGFALECLFKAVWVKRGNQLASGGRLQPIKGAAPHDLLQLADKLQFQCAPNERDVLKRLSLFITSVGRYPIATDWGQTKIQKSFDGAYGPPTYLVSPRDYETYGALVIRLNAELDK